MNRISRPERWAGAALCAALCAFGRWAEAESPRPGEAVNALLITVDDMNYNTPGFTGNPVPHITPHIDKLATEGLWIRHAHVTVAICQPSRQCLMTGRYPHNNGAPGFDPIRADVPTLQEQLRAAGYLNGILGKVIHLCPREKFCWDFAVDQADLGEGRDPALYRKYVREFLAKAREAGKPFFLMANSHDPHRPFAGNDKGLRERAAKPFPEPDRAYRPAEAHMPGFLPDLPDIRLEVSEYYGSCRRADQTVGEVLRALSESGFVDNTLVMFLSDNGMAFPFAKANCYLASTRTPWLVRWPGRIKAGTIEERQMVSGIDFMPTILDALGLKIPEGLDGRSILPLLLGEKQAGRENVMTVINTLSSKRPYPMRALQTPRFSYIYNSWSDGKTAYKNESMSGRTWKAMQGAAETDERVAARTRLFQFRKGEEFYDLDADPDTLKNLAEDGQYREPLREMRRLLEKEMAASRDPLLDGFRAYLRGKGEAVVPVQRD